MTINDYIWWGGENLNKKPFFSNDEVESNYSSIFNSQINTLRHPILADEILLYDMPLIGKKSRLIIAVYKEKNDTSRAVSWYLGLIVKKSLYAQLPAIQCLYLGLNNLSLSRIKQAVVRKTMLKINVDVPVEKTPIWTPVNDLIHFEIIKPFPQNIKELSQLISINNIDDWFDKLFIAVNPAKYNDEFTTIVATKKPAGYWGEKKESRVKNQPVSSAPPKKIKEIKRK